MLLDSFLSSPLMRSIILALVCVVVFDELDKLDDVEERGDIGDIERLR